MSNIFCRGAGAGMARCAVRAASSGATPVVDRASAGLVPPAAAPYILDPVGRRCCAAPFPGGDDLTQRIKCAQSTDLRTFRQALDALDGNMGMRGSAPLPLKRYAARSVSAFTLVEILVVMSLLSLIVL